MTLKDQLKSLRNGDMDATLNIYQAVLDELDRLERALADQRSYILALERELEQANEKPASEG
jgi:hypothetical protein